MPARTQPLPPPADQRYSHANDLDAVDHSAIFLAYLTFTGDVQKVALATDTPVHLVAKLEAQEDWQSKLKALQPIKDAGRAGEFEQAVNRTMNFVQAVQLRKLVELALRALLKNSRDPAATLEQFIGTNRQGNSELSLRPLIDLVKAADTAQHLTYRALGDHSDVDIANLSKNHPESPALAWRRALEALDDIPGTSGVDLVRQGLTELECVQDPRGRDLDDKINLTKPGETPPADKP